MGYNLILNRNYVLATTKGHVIEFKKGVPVYVPDSVLSEALAIGAVTKSGEPPVLEEEKAPSGAPSGLMDRLAALEKAIDTLVKRNARGDFTAAGAPSLNALKEILGWVPSPRELQQAWLAYAERNLAPTGKNG
jgi:hypothetical protein